MQLPKTIETELVTTSFTRYQSEVYNNQCSSSSSSIYYEVRNDTKVFKAPPLHEAYNMTEEDFEDYRVFYYNKHVKDLRKEWIEFKV
jgi:hypothetical protein